MSVILERDQDFESGSLQWESGANLIFVTPLRKNRSFASSWLRRILRGCPVGLVEQKGPVLNVMGRVLNLSGEPVRTAKVEVWQANAEIARVAVHAPVRQAPGALAGADHPQANGYDLVKVDPTGRLLAVWISFSAATTTRAYSLHRRRRRSL